MIVGCLVALADRQDHVSQFAWASLNSSTVDSEELDEKDQRNALVAVDARLTLRKAIKQRRGLVGE